MESNFAKDFKQCPNCGSDQRFMEQLGQELKDRKLAGEETNIYFSQASGTLMDGRKAAFMPIGIMLPGFQVATDICMDCGTIYAVRMVRLESKFMGVQKKVIEGLNLN